jgi:hypothetical protein
MEELRKLKDKNIIDLEDTLERKRVSYEINIDSLKITIRELEASNLQKASTIISLQERLNQLSDVYQQL